MSHKSPGGAPPSAASTAPSNLRSALTAFYQAIEPAKVGTVDTILQKYAGREATLLAHLGEKYEKHPAMSLLAGAAVDAADQNGWTALMSACENGHEGAARLLLTAGAAVDAATQKGVTALMAACLGGHEGAARLLLEEGAAVDAARQDGVTALRLSLIHV